MRSRAVGEGNSVFLQVLKGVVFGLFVILVAILLFALIIKVTELSSSLIQPINQGIKALGVFFACLVSVSNKRRGWLTGLFTGLFVALISYLLFSLIAGSLHFGKGVLLDLIFGAVVGAISGIIAKNVKS